MGSDTAIVFVALGSNLGDREAHIQQAFEQISALPESSDIHCSSLYETDPMGPQNQPDYLNAVCRFSYQSTAEKLLNDLQQIEKLHGRVKAERRWIARPLDLDILLFGNQIIESEDLCIPHVGIADRSFVLWPLMELQPDLLIPGKGAVSELRNGCQKFGIKPYSGNAK